MSKLLPVFIDRSLAYTVRIARTDDALEGILDHALMIHGYEMDDDARLAALSAVQLVLAQAMANYFRHIDSETFRLTLDAQKNPDKPAGSIHDKAHNSAARSFFFELQGVGEKIAARLDPPPLPVPDDVQEMRAERPAIARLDERPIVTGAANDDEAVA